MFLWPPRAARRLSSGAAGAVACGAVALWVSFGALSFVDVDNSAPYVGILPSFAWLAALVVAGAICVVAFRPPASAVAPLWLSAVAILPWLPLPLPWAAFIWTGNIRLWLWAAIAVALVAPVIGRRSALVTIPPRQAALLAGVLGAVFYGLVTWSVAPAHPNGDEPHYLVITQSLLADHDILIENNHAQGDFQAYMDLSIKPDFLKRGLDGQIYSIHAPGLSLFVAPGFALFGYAGVLVELLILSAAASALLWLIAWRVTRSAAASWFGWATVALSVPFVFHASAVFPDGLGAVLVVVAMLPLVDERARTPGMLLAAGAALAALPWLSSRFVVLAVAAALVIAGRLWTDPRPALPRLAAFSLIPIISGIAFVLFFQIIYGTPNPSVVYGETPTMTMDASNLVRGIPGLLFDQQFGLFPNAPVYLCACAGFVAMLLWGPRRLGLELLFITIAYFLVGAGFTSWWGGTTAPARYLVPLTPLLAIPAAVWFARFQDVAMKTVNLAALLLSVLITVTIAAVDRGAFVFNFRDGMSRVGHWLSPVVDLTTALPSLFQNPPGLVVLQSALWLLAMTLAAATAVYFGHRGRTAAIVAFGLAFEVTTMAAASLVWRSNSAVVLTPGTGGAAVLRRVDPGARQVAVGYQPFRMLDRTDLPGKLVLARAPSTDGGIGPASILRVPAGTYEVAGVTTGGPVTGRVRLRTDRGSGPIAEWDAAALGSSWTRQVTLPVALASLQFEVDAGARQAIRDVSIRAVSVSLPEEGMKDREAGRGSRYGPATVFLMEGRAWVEPSGIWVAAGSGADFVVAPDSQGPVRLLVRNGPVQNAVRIESGGWGEMLALQPGEERLLQLPTDIRRRTTPLHVQASSGFRPADVDRKSDDWRLLGVWIETR